MKLVLYRQAQSAISTMGELFRDGAHQCFTLELPVRDGKPGSAIPAGIYSIELATSPKFEELARHDPWWGPYWDAMPHIVDIPGRSLIMIHVGNLPSDTDGCILVGTVQGMDSLGASRPAFAKLFSLIQQAVETVDGCQIEIHDPPAAPAMDVDLSTQV